MINLMIKSSKYYIIAAFMLSIPHLLFSQNEALLNASFLLDQERYEDVIKILEPLSQMLQETPEYFDILGEAAFQSDDYELALRVYEKRIGLDNPEMAYYQLSRISFLMNMELAGYQYLKIYLKSDNHLLLQDIIADKAFEDKIRDREWIRFWSTEGYTEKDDLIAEARAQLKEEEPDAGVYKRLQQSYPNEAQSWYLTGRYNEFVGNSRQAKADFQKAIELAPGSTEYMNYLANYYAGLKKYNESTALIVNSLTISNYQPSLWMLRISNHLNMDDNQGAMREMQYLEKIGVESSDLWISLAKQVKNTDMLSAIGLLDRVINQNPLNNAALNIRAGMYWELQNYDNALNDWAMSLDIDPRQSDIYFMRGEARYQIEDYDGACHDWKKALRYGHRKALDKLYKYCSSTNSTR